MEPESPVSGKPSSDYQSLEQNQQQIQIPQQQLQEMASDSPRTGVSHSEPASKSNYEKVFFYTLYRYKKIQIPTSAKIIK